MKKIVMDDFLSDDESEESNRILTTKQIDKDEFEKNKANFDFKKLLSSFILKKDYFISHKTTDIFLDYDIDDKPIGEGSFGVVYKAVEKSTNIVRAVKQIFNENITNYDGFMTEVSALKTLDHPNVVKLFEVYQDKNCVFLVLEYLDGGELFDYITDRDHLTEEESAIFFKQMMSSIIYCHKNRICHRDLKPDNFMLVHKGEASNIKLIDFGLSRSFYKFQGEGKGEVIRMETKVGTSLYMAPEVLNKSYSSACDTWSLGVILYIMLCGCPPFDGDSDKEIYDSIKSLKYDFEDEPWEKVSDEAKDLVSKILVEEKNRITPKEALNHPWTKKFNTTESIKVAEHHLFKL
jgi:calcium-dependent protein kinase